MSAPGIEGILPAARIVGQPPCRLQHPLGDMRSAASQLPPGAGVVDAASIDDGLGSRWGWAEPTPVRKGDRIGQTWAIKMGNAVPSLLTEILGREIRYQPRHRDGEFSDDRGQGRSRGYSRPITSARCEAL